jgi:hypothetical protein
MGEHDSIEDSSPEWADIERSLAAGEHRQAVLQCADLVGRLLTFWGMEGVDPGLTALLLGISGADWIHFQRAVRVAREGGAIPTAVATECFAFVLGAASRRAR